MWLLMGEVMSLHSQFWILSHFSYRSVVIKYIFFFMWAISVQLSCPVVFDSLQPHGLQHARPHCPSRAPGVFPNSCPLTWWCLPTFSSSVIPFSCPQAFPASESFQISQLFASGDQSIGVSATTSVLPMNIQDWFPLGWTGWISLQSKMSPSPHL